MHLIGFIIRIHILNLNNQTKNSDDDDKHTHNPQAKLPALYWHNQNPNHSRNVNGVTAVTV